MTLTVALCLLRGAARRLRRLPWPSGARRPRRASSTALSIAIAAISLVAAARISRSPAAAPASLALPLGLPWLGAHFRLDALSAFFLARRRSRRRRARACSRSATARTKKRPSACCRSIPAFLAGMNLVVLADDAFTFLVSWEFMSLTSWALVMAHHRVRGERARRLRLSGDGELRHARAAARLRPARRARRRLCVRANRAPRIPPPCSARWCWSWCCSAPARRPAWCRCTSGCRSPIRRRRATSRR